MSSHDSTGFKRMGPEPSALQMQVPGHVIARILNHKQTDVTSAVYNKYQYLKEKREALDLWGAKVARIVSGLKSVRASPTEA